MNREVELVLSGLHASGQEQESEAVETVQPAQYFKRNDSHYLLYEEKMLGIETGRVLVEEQEDQIHVTVEYTLDHEGEPLSESCLKIHIREK